MKGKNKLKKKTLILVSFLFIVFCVFASASGLIHQITTFITSKVASAFNTQDYLEINRENTPKINVRVDSSNTFATVQITNYPTDATSKQYKTDSSRDWVDYTGEFTIEDNTIIQTRYKNDGDEDYTKGSSKVILDLIYNFELKKPQAELKQGDTTFEQEKLSLKALTLNLSSEDEESMTILYEASVTRYSVDESGLMNSDGTLNVDNIKNAGNEAEYSNLETNGDYTKINDSSLKLEEDGIYKIKIRATTEDGFVKSEEIEIITAVWKLITVSDIKQNPSAYYGKTLTNYTANGITWKIFYADEDKDRLFLIASDYVPKSKLPVSKMSMKTSGTYCGYWTYGSPPASQSSSVTSEIKKLFKYNYYLVVGDSGKCISTMLNPNNWTSFVNAAYADYAVGTPTIEMWVASWNDMYPNNKKYWDDNGTYGYRVGNSWDNMYARSGACSAIDLPEDADSLYVPHWGQYSGCNGYWLASQGGGDLKNILYMHTQSNIGTFVGATIYNYTGYGFRPVVSIKAGTLFNISGSNYKIEENIRFN